MTTTIKASYGTETPIVVTGVASLANLAVWQLAVIDNSVNLFLDVMLEFAFKLQAGAPSGPINLYGYAGIGGAAARYSSNIDGTNKLGALGVPNDLALLATRDCNDGIVGSGGTAILVVPSLAAYFNGILPAKWGILVENQSGFAFSATAGDHAGNYRGLQAQGV
jgi:hypothetical protein